MATTAPTNFNLHLTSFDANSRNRQAAPAAAADDLDDLFDYDAGMEEMLREVDTNTDVPAQSSNKGGKSAGAGDALGIDEEIQVTKKRRVNVKLDENR